MTASLDLAPNEGFARTPGASAPLAKTRPFYWSVRRELWENRAIYLAPLIAAGVVLFGVALGHLHLLHVQANQQQGFGSFDGGRTRIGLPPIIPYLIGAGPIVVTTLIVGVFYCLAALNAERRDRSVLFWKSLPVSDLTTVLSKAVIPAIVLPVVALVVIIATQLAMLALDLASAAVGGQDLGTLLAQLPLGHVWLDLGYLLLVIGLWYAPVWGWLLLVSAWSKRMTFLWGVGPPLAVCVIERMAFGTGFAWNVLKSRLAGGLADAFARPPANTMVLPWPDPLGFLAMPGLWIGLVVGAACLAGAVWLRRRREPV
jgi:ABC-2 type transport system permease protein